MTYTEFLLEEIAANTRGMLVEKNTYLETLRNAYASSQQKSAAVYGNLRTQPAAREGQVSQYVKGQDARVRSNVDQGTPQTQKKS